MENSALNCVAYNTFVGVKSDHRIVTAKIRLSLRANIKKSSNTVHYDWSTLATNADIQQQFTVSVKTNIMRYVLRLIQIHLTLCTII